MIETSGSDGPPSNEGPHPLIFQDGYSLTLALEPDGRLRAVVDSHGVDGIDSLSFGTQNIVEAARHAHDGERRSAEWAERLRRLTQDRRPIRCTAWIPGTAPGRLDTVECVATPVPAADGSLECILIEANDRTSTNQVEQRLLDSESQFRTLAESLPQMVWVADASGAVVYFSPQWEHFTGRTQEELLGDGFMDLVPEEDHAALRAQVDTAGEFQVHQFRLRRHDGEVRWMEANYRIMTDDAGNLIRWIGGTTDITDRRLAADEMREQQEQLRSALALTGLGRYSLYLRDGRIDGDARNSEIHGLDVGALAASEGFGAAFALIHEDDIDRVRAGMEAAVAGGPDQDVEYRIWRDAPDGSGDRELGWVAARGRVEFDEDGPVRLVGVVEDITQRKLEEAARLRWQKREEISALASGVAHDFNNVISAILSNAALAETEMKLGASPETSIAEIAKGAERAADIVKRLLAIGREDEPTREAFDLCEVAEEACSLVQATLPPDVALRCECEEHVPLVFGSSTQLHQVIVNLVANAKYALDGRGGTIDVCVSQVFTPAPAVDGKTPEQAIRVTVCDDGPGILQSAVPKIFDPFFTTKPAGKGTGLGLAAARTILDNHGGSITARNRAGGGACFSVLVPTVDEVVGSAPPAGELDDQSLLPLPSHPVGRIFFVDDEAALVRLAERALPARGYAVRAFTDPSAALAAISDQPDAVDVLITDLSMPGLSGLELIQRVRGLRPDLPVVLSSGFLTAANREEADRHGVDVIVPKPCSVDDLAAAVVELLARNRHPA